MVEEQRPEISALSTTRPPFDEVEEARSAFSGPQFSVPSAVLMLRRRKERQAGGRRRRQSARPAHRGKHGRNGLRPQRGRPRPSLMGSAPEAQAPPPRAVLDHFRLSICELLLAGGFRFFRSAAPRRDPRRLALSASSSADQPRKAAPGHAPPRIVQGDAQWKGVFRGRGLRLRDLRMIHRRHRTPQSGWLGIRLVIERQKGPSRGSAGSINC